MKRVLAVIALATFVLLIDVCDRLITKFIKRKREQYAAEINAQCDETEARADGVGQQIIEAMEAVENADWMSEDDKKYFLNKYQSLLDSVSKTRQNVVNIRSNFQ